MYNGHFGFDTEPFRVTPDPRFLYLSDSHREALASLVYTVQERKGFVVLTGEVGTGKTTVLNALLRKLHPGVQAAYIFNTMLTVPDFFTYLFEELELEPVAPFQKSTALARLNRYLIERLKQGLQTLLIVDEAQNLSPELLEEVRMLSNLETPQSKLLHIVLVGQPELGDKLRRADLRQLRQRVELWSEIEPLTLAGTGEYVRERLLIAGHETGEIFTKQALRAVYQYARGIPRVINVLCDNALLTAFSKRALRVSAKMVEESAHELGLGDGQVPIQRAGSEGAVEKEGFKKEGWLRRIWPKRPADAELV